MRRLTTVLTVVALVGLFAVPAQAAKPSASATVTAVSGCDEITTFIIGSMQYEGNYFDKKPGLYKFTLFTSGGALWAETALTQVPKGTASPTTFTWTVDGLQDGQYTLVGRLYSAKGKGGTVANKALATDAETGIEVTFDPCLP